MHRDHPDDRWTVFQQLAVLDRLDERSRRQPPKRLTTLLRRTVDALPYELSRTLRGTAPPPARAPAMPYGHAFLALLRAYDALGPGNIARGIDLIERRLGELAAVAGCPPPVDAARMRVVEDAFIWRAAQLGRSARPAERIELLERHVALVGEGLLPRGDAAMEAAVALAEHATRLPDYEQAARYATLALTWGGGDRGPLYSALAGSVAILVDAGELERAIELGDPLLARVDVWDELDPHEYPAPAGYAANAVQIGGALAYASRRLGHHTDARTRAGHTLWRAIRSFGADSPLATSCQLLLADCLIDAERWGEAEAMTRPAFKRLRGAGPEHTRELVYAGIRLAVALGHLDRLDDARAVAREIDELASRRFPVDDDARHDARSARAHFEHRV